MTNHKIQFVGAPCGHHGNYTFYKAFKYSLHGKQKILALGEFFFIKIWEEEDIISIGEAQLLWEDKSSGQILVSLRLYFLPENTPDGRCDEHGEHEVVSLAEKVILRAEDVINIMRAASGVKWDTGLIGVYSPNSLDTSDPNDTPVYMSPLSQSLDIKEVLREKSIIGDVIDSNTLHVIVLSYDKYCRMRALLKRIEGVEDEALKYKTLRALGGFLVPSRRTHLIFCRDIFEYPELEGHDLLCNHLAPKLQGRPRKKKSRRPDSESESSETSEETKPRLKSKPGILTKSNALMRGLTAKTNILSSAPKINSTPKIKIAPPPPLPNQIRNEFSTPAMNRLIEVDFMSKLYKFMKDRNTAITRLPYIGYKQLNVFELFTRVQQLGGYDVVGQKKLWKHLYEDLIGKQGGHPQNPAQNLHSGVNGLKRHYERLLLPYENYLLQEQKRILGIDTKRPSNKSQKLLHRHQKHNNPSAKNHSQSPQSKHPQQLFQHLPQHNPQPQHIKNDPGEPSVSILQPVHSDPFGASFQVADGGSTTITLVPLSEADQVAGSSSGSNGSNRNSPTNVSQSFSLTPQSRNSPSPHLYSSPDFTVLVPKVNVKKEDSVSSDMAKRPEITITPIPRSLGHIGAPGPLTPLQLVDLMSLNLNSSLGVSALQDLARIAERYDRATCEPSPKKLKSEEGSARMNGASHRCNSSMDGSRNRSPCFAEQHHFSKSSLPVPELISPDFLRQMNAVETSSKLLLPAHQSTKTINALAALLPQTSIFPAPPPAAHQQHNKFPHKHQTEVSKQPAPVFQSYSAYSQSKCIYGKPMADVTKEASKDNKRSSPEIEILDLRIPNENKSKNSKSRNDRLEIELLDLSTRRDITVSAVPKPGTSKNHSSAKIPPPQVSIRSTDSGKSSLLGALQGSSISQSYSGAGNKHNAANDITNNPLIALVSTLAAQGIPPSTLASLGLGSPLFNYLMSSGMKSNSPSQGSVPMIPVIDPAALASYYSLLPPGLVPSPGSSSNSSHSNNAVTAAAAHQAAAAAAAAAAQLVQLNSLGLSGLVNVPHEAMASLGIYKNYLPQGSFPPPHFLSGLMSPGGHNPPTSK